MDIYFILWILIQYYHFLFCCSKGSAFPIRSPCGFAARYLASHCSMFSSLIEAAAQNTNRNYFLVPLFLSCLKLSSTFILFPKSNSHRILMASTQFGVLHFSLKPLYFGLVLASSIPTALPPNKSFSTWQMK